MYQQIKHFFFLSSVIVALSSFAYSAVYEENFENDSIRQSGGIGVWTKADAVTSFDDFTVKGRE